MSILPLFELVLLYLAKSVKDSGEGVSTLPVDRSDSGKGVSTHLVFDSTEMSSVLHDFNRSRH